MTTFNTIEEALADLSHGKMIILVDDEHRENEGDLIIAAEHATPDAINFMIKNARGLLCLALDHKEIERLRLPMMTEDNRAKRHTAFTVSIEAASGITTGISAYDRAHTIKVAIDPNSTPQDLVSPGHIFPLKAMPGGVLQRTGHTEGAVDLMRLCGLRPGAVLCEVMNNDGSMARLNDLELYREEFGIKVISIEQIKRYRLTHEMLVQEFASAKLPTEEWGELEIRVFKNPFTHDEYIVLQKGDLIRDNSLVRLHSECLTGDVFGSQRCDCGWQLQTSLDKITKEGGLLIYLRQEGRGIGLANKIKAYALQDQGLDTVSANHQLGFPADVRDYAMAAQILKYLGVNRIRLLTNNPSKLDALKAYGVDMIERVPLQMHANQHNKAYLKVKKDKLGHLLQFGDEA